MYPILTQSNIVFVAGALGCIFTVYNYFRNPQIQSDKKDALLDQRTKWESESNNQRFNDMQTSFQSLLLQSNNHIHTVDVKVEALNATIATMGNEITRLATIIEERIPKK